MNPFEYNGLWWTPGDPDNKVAGRLRFSDEDGLVLSLMGTVGKAPVRFGEKREPIILGHSHDSKIGGSVTLLGCVQKSFTWGVPAYARESYFAESGMFGVHLGASEDPLFVSCQLRLGGLHHWAGRGTAIEQDIDGERAPISIRLDARQRDPYEFRLPGCRMLLFWGLSIAESHFRVELEESVALSLGAEEPLSIGDWHRLYVSPLQDFFTFALDAPTRVDEVNFSLPGQSSTTIRHVRPRIYSKPPSDDGFIPDRMLFSFADVEGRANELVRRWLEFQSRYGQACGVFFGSLYAHQSYIESRLLPVMQALELYQRPREGGERRDRVRRSVPGDLLLSTPDSDREKVIAWMTERHVDTFAETLRSLITEHAEAFAPVMPRGVGEFIAEAMRIRSFALYREGDTGELEGYGQRVYLLLTALGFLFKACLLKELGFTDRQRVDLLARNRMFDFVREMAHKAHTE